MNRISDLALRSIVAALFLCFGVTSLRAQAQPQTQTPATSPSQQTADKDKAKDADKAKDEEEDNNPFAPEPAPPLPPGMTGSDANDPRAKLTPGLYDAGVASMGLKHLLLLKKPDAFQLD